MENTEKLEMMKKHAEESMAEFEKNKPQMIHQDFKDHPNNMANWYPTLKEVTDTPRTTLVDIAYDVGGDFINGEKSERAEEFLSRMEAALDQIGYPAFIRSGIMSAKHSWKDTCSIPERLSLDDLSRHVYSIIEMNAMPTCFAVRELIKTKPIFKAFWGEMPITREFRAFIRDGKVECIHPYWPLEAFENEELTAEQLEALKAMNFLTPPEVELLTIKSTIVAKSFPGYWSVDWLEDENRHWWCIDMATGESSYHWKGCAR